MVDDARMRGIRDRFGESVNVGVVCNRKVSCTVEVEAKRRGEINIHIRDHPRSRRSESPWHDRDYGTVHGP